MLQPEYYTPASIRYNRSQVLWLIKNILDADNWPSEHRESGYSGGPKTKTGHHAHYEDLRMISAELLHRITSCGADGLALEFVTRLSEGDDIYLEQRIANYQHRSFESVHHGVKTALRYCCGKRKLISYSRYCYLLKSWDEKRESRLARPAPVISFPASGHSGR